MTLESKSATSALPALPAAFEPRDRRWLWGGLAAAAVALVVLYATDMLALVERWATDAAWGHGFVIPLFACYFVYLKWDVLHKLTPRGSIWGIAILLIGIVGQALFRATGMAHVSLLSIVVSIYGLALFVFGWEYMKVLWLPIAYLGFALPPPTPLYVSMTMPMQAIAAELGIQVLPLFGAEATRNGTVIDLSFSTGSTRMMVAEACSGMKMLLAFFALSVAMAYSSTRPMSQKITLALFALPIAILCNGFRVAIIGVLAVKVDPSLARGNQHLYIGFVAMLIPAILMQLAVAWVLDRMFVNEPDEPGVKPA